MVEITRKQPERGDVAQRTGLPEAFWPAGGTASLFRNEFDKLFDSFFGGSRTWPGALGQWGLEPFGQTGGGALGVLSPQVDIRETEDAFELAAELPGLEEKEVDITLANDTLTIRGEKKSEHEDKTDTYHLTERRYGSFQRQFRLPETVDQGKIKARFDKGVLHVTMPKSKESKASARRIEIGK